MKIKDDMLFKLILILSLSMGSLWGDPPKSLTFLELSKIDSLDEAKESLHAKEVKIRGFVYQTSDGRVILAGKPDLRTCCVGSVLNVWQQIALDVPAEDIPAGQAVTVEGWLHVNPIYDSQNNLKQVFSLYKTRYIKGNKLSYTMLWLVLAFITAALSLFLIIRRNIKHE